MSVLTSFTVRRVRKGSGAGKFFDYDSVAMGVNLDSVDAVWPSVCDKDGVSDGLVNAEIWVRTGYGAGEHGTLIKYWVTSDVATIVALDDA